MNWNAVMGVYPMVLAVVAWIILITVNALRMRKDPLFHPFPAVTRCRICEKRVFVWQRRERRAYKMALDNPDRLAVTTGASGIVHKHCQGNPVFSLSIKRG